MLPSKIRPTISALRLITGEPELPPMMSLVVTKSSGVARSSLLAALQVARGQVERPFEIEAGGAVVQPVEGGLVGRLGAVHGIALHLAVGEPQRERGIGIGGLAVDREARLAELLAGALLHALTRCPPAT